MLLFPPKTVISLIIMLNMAIQTFKHLGILMFDFVLIRTVQLFTPPMTQSINFQIMLWVEGSQESYSSVIRARKLDKEFNSAELNLFGWFMPLILSLALANISSTVNWYHKYSQFTISHSLAKSYPNIYLKLQICIAQTLSIFNLLRTHNEQILWSLLLGMSA